MGYLHLESSRKLESTNATSGATVSAAVARLVVLFGSAAMVRAAMVAGCVEVVWVTEAWCVGRCDECVDGGVGWAARDRCAW